MSYNEQNRLVIKWYYDYIKNVIIVYTKNKNQPIDEIIISIVNNIKTTNIDRTIVYELLKAIKYLPDTQIKQDITTILIILSAELRQ